jgi:hypothetical protein
MAQDSIVSVKFGATTEDLVKGVQQVQSVLQAGFGQMQSSINGLNGSVQSSFSGIQNTINGALGGIGVGIKAVTGVFALMTSVLGGGAVFKEMVSATTAWAGEVKTLGRVMGVSSEEASVYNVALRLIGKTSEDLTGAFSRLLRQIKSNEEGIRALGLETRTSDGHLKGSMELMQEAFRVMMEYREGADRDAAGMYFFGKSAMEVQGLMRLNEEIMRRASRAAEEFGLKIGKDATDAASKYKVNMAELGVAMEGFKVTVGSKVIPTLLELAKALNKDLPDAISFTARAFRLFFSPIDAVNTALWQCYEMIKTFVVSSQQAITGFSLAMDAIFKGLFDHAREITKATVEAMENTWSHGFDRVVELGNGYAQRMQSIFARVQPGANLAGDAAKAAIDAFLSQGGDKPWVDPKDIRPPGSTLDGKRGGGGKSDNVYSQWREELQQMIDAQEDLLADTKKLEMEFWQDKLKTAKAGTKEYAQALHEFVQLKRVMLRDEQTMSEGIQDIRTQADLDGMKHRIAMEAEEISVKRRMGLISSQEEIRMLIDLENREHEIEWQALMDRMRMRDKDLLDQAKTYHEIEVLQEKHMLKLAQITNKEVKKEKTLWQTLGHTITQSVGQAIQGLATKTTTVGQALQSVLGAVFDAIIGKFGEMVTNMIDGMSLAEAAEMAFGMKSAAVGAVKAGESVAAIPGWGWAMVAAVVAGTLALLMGTLSSAAGGWEVPEDTLAQVHKNEMVLPAHLSDRIRNMTEPGLKGGPTVHHHHYTINAMDGESVERVLKKHGSALARGIQTAKRDLRFRGIKGRPAGAPA